MKNNLRPQAGFTLIEMAIVLLIMGLVVGAIFSFLSVEHTQQAEEVTKVREQKIANALAYYAQMHNVLPCPGLPDDPIQGNSHVAVCLTQTDRTGIVPYRVLGLSQEDVTDGFNRPISYTLSATAALPGLMSEAACRTSSWMTGSTAPPNINYNKSLFCCPDLSAGLMMQIYIDPVTHVSATTLQTPGSGAYSGPNTMSLLQSTMTTQDYFAYILVSHGKNGLGAFNFCQPGAVCNHSRSDTSNAGDSEKENANNDDIFVDAMQNTGSPPSAYYDDIVLWRTQSRLMSEFNNDSCAKP
jgi:prepilin-type N-terminal cleavage/methylation domain-containing protein